jgi:hypothetical protein
VLKRGTFSVTALFLALFLGAWVFSTLAMSPAMAQEYEYLAPLTDNDLNVYIKWCQALPGLSDENGDVDPDVRVNFFAENGIGMERFVVLNERLSHVIFGMPLVQTQTITDDDIKLIQSRQEDLEKAIYGSD